MRLQQWFGALLLVLCLPCLAQSQYSAETLRKIREVESGICGDILINDEKPVSLLERMAALNVKGLSIAVIEHDSIVWAKAYGWADEERKVAVQTTTLFEPGSISKALNAVGVLALAQQKKVDLYTDINRYLHSWKFPYDSVSKGRVISLADILSHNAGLSVHGFPGHDREGPIPTVLQVLNGESPSFTPAVRSMFEPGLQFMYSGGGTTISQVIVTDVTRQPYEQWMWENVLKPLGMTHSSYAQPPTSDKLALCATGYHRDGTAIHNSFHVYPEQAAAGLWTTPSDLCRYIIDVQRAQRGTKKSAVLQPESVKLHLSPYNNGPASMGVFIEDHDGATYFEHGASNDGFCGDFVASLDEGYGVAVFLNSDNPTLIRELINSVARVYNWKNYYREPVKKKTMHVPDSILARYEGIYLYDQSWAAVGKNGSAYQFYVNGDYVNMYFTSPTCFFNKEYPAVKEFVVDSNAQILGYTRTVGAKSFPRSTKILNPDTLHLSENVLQEIGWYLFEAKRYKESLVYLKRGAELYPANLDMLMTLANVLLYSGNTTAALDIYKSHRNEIESPGNSWETMLQSYIRYFKEHDYDVSIFDVVLKELGIKER